jgi:hypothetical protein
MGSKESLHFSEICTNAIPLLKQQDYMKQIKFDSGADSIIKRDAMHYPEARLLFSLADGLKHAYLRIEFQLILL